MDIDTIADIVTIIAGTIAIIVFFQGIFQPGETSPLVKLLFAIGIVTFLLGAANIIFSMLEIESSKESCIQGREQFSSNIIQICDQIASSKYTTAIKPGSISIGISFLFLPIAILIKIFGNPKTTTFQLVLLIMWLVLGIWLILSNL